MSKIPSASKELPAGELDNKEQPKELVLGKVIPAATAPNNTILNEMPKLEIVPKESEKKEEQPEPSVEKEEKPEASAEKTEKPSDELEENCVMVGDKKIELKPTKLKYFRNKAASAYGIIKAVPLHELLTYGKGVIDETRDADQLLYDFLVAAFDDKDLVRENYDEFDADTIDRICKIFGRLNHIDEKEEQARKNREAQAQAKR